MTASRWDSTPSARLRVGDVVAGLLDDDAVTAVARAAVREALARGARVRFLQVAAEDYPAAARETAPFAAALRALREAPQLPVTFETVAGEIGPTFVQRSADASVLVVGRDGRPGEAGTVAAYCQTHATCDVLTVNPEPGGTGAARPEPSNTAG